MLFFKVVCIKLPKNSGTALNSENCGTRWGGWVVESNSKHFSMQNCSKQSDGNVQTY